MPRIERSRNTDFEIYMKEIINHPNYRGLPIEQKRDGSLAWFAFANGAVGQARKRWAEDKARELGFSIKPGVYAEVMREIHPTKMHVCQICGSLMSIYYYYPSANFVKSLNTTFGLKFNECDHINDIWNNILDNGFSENDLIIFLKRKFGLPEITGLYPVEVKEHVKKQVRKQWSQDDYGLFLVDVNDLNKNGIIELCERMCRVFGKKFLSPGAMSNFPDRFDGFHTYNRCCRAEQDTGRSKENLKSYTKDRRAYEYWSDGNLHAANMFMGSQFFRGVSADHIGAISLGFIHDPRYLRPMTSGDNSTKRDRLLIDDIKNILAVESETGVYPMSWYSAEIWEYIKENYILNPNRVASHYRNMLKQNMTNFMFILLEILENSGERGRVFLFEEFIKPKYENFLYSYKFDEYGNIVSQTPRNFTERSNYEINRFERIAFDAIYDYNEKSNRHLSHDITDSELADIKRLCKGISIGRIKPSCREQMENIIYRIEERIIQTEIAEQARR